MTLPTLHTLPDVAKSLGMSERWLRQQIADGAEHTRLGQKIRFTDAQVQKLIDDKVKSKAPQSITTGRKRSA